MLKFYTTAFFILTGLVGFSQKSYDRQLSYVEPCETYIDESEADGLLIVWPNPANEQVTVQCAFAGKIQITDSKGQLMYTSVQSQSGEQTIKLTDFAAGTYFVRLITEKQIYLTKIVVTHD